MITLITRFMGPTWGPTGANRTQVGPILATWTLLSGKLMKFAVSINGDPLEQVCSTKYLGVTVDNTLSWDSQCDNLCFKLAGKIAVLRRIRSFVKTETLKLLYEKTIQPVMDYACSAWCHTKKSNINKLQRVQIMLLVLLLAILIT